MPTLTYRQVISLSHPIHPGMPRWAGDPAVEMETIALWPIEGYYLRRIVMGEHSATHMNAPKSFFPDGMGIEEYVPDSLILPAIVVDGRSKTSLTPDYCLQRDDLLAWEAQHGSIPAGSLVIFWTGWQDKWLDTQAFFNQDAEGVCHFPGFAIAATEFLVQERAIAGIGIDTHGVDPSTDPTFPVNRLVLGQQGIVLENLTHLDQLPATGSTIAIGLLPLIGGSGSPVSVLAFLP